MRAFAHLHEAEVECRCFCDDSGNRREFVAVPDATGEEGFGIIGVALLIRELANGKADFAVMCGDKVGDEVAFGGISRGFQKPSEGRGEFVAQAAIVFRCF